MRLAVVGSRGFKDQKSLDTVLDDIHKNNGITEIVTGGAVGADTYAEEWAKKNNVKVTVFKPDWETYGKAAGYRRNVTIWDNSDIGLAFWDGKSPGTEHSFGIAKKQNKRLMVYRYDLTSREDSEYIDFYHKYSYFLVS